VLPTEVPREHRTGLTRLIQWALLSFILAPLWCEPAFPQADMDREQAESRLQQIQVEIRQLQDQLENSRSEQKTEQDRLRTLDLQLQKVNLDLRELDAQQNQHLEELGRLEKQRDEFLASLNLEQAQLAEQLRSAYRLGRQSRLQLLLNQDSPAQMGRMLAYYDYINRSGIEQISGLREALSTLDTMQASIDGELLRLNEVRTDQERLFEQLDNQRGERQVLLAGLADQINNEESQLQELQKNRQDLQTLITRLADVLADIPPDLGRHLSIAGQKGSVPMPISGPVRYAFGQRRAGGLRWQGWLIGAEAGTTVNAVAYGRVAFADWLRGYGLLIIIDHGEGFMSLYGHNESLLHEAGDWVEPGQAISVVGISAGNDQGLYFELRKGGRVVDPAVWLKR
jgi:septal ring factor EnvC (AmiA/AmiB activator)